MTEHNIEIPTIADTCMLAVLSRKRLRTTRQVAHHVRDTVRQQLGDESLTLSKHLFKEGPVRDLLRLLDRAYDEHKDITAAYIDRGPRVLPGDMFDIYAETMEGYKAKIEAEGQKVFDNWDALCDADVEHRKRKCLNDTQRSLVSRSEYPTQEQAEHMFSMTWCVRPIPKGEDFRTQVPEYMKARLQDELDEAVSVVRRDMIQRMLKPVADAVEKLKVPIGEKGSVFRDSLVENLQHSLHTAKSLNVNDDPALSDAITEMNLVVNGYVGSADSMRTMQEKRDMAAKKLDELVGTFTSLV